MEYIHQLRMKVRDYECDLQGIVNNANYQHYLEHARHEFLMEHGISFSRLHDQGIDAVVAKITISFKTPLRSNDEFICCLNLKHEGARYIFLQDIYRVRDNKLAIRAHVDSVCVDHGVLMTTCPQLDEKLEYLMLNR